MTLELSLHLEGRRRKQRPGFGLVSRAAARALVAGSRAPLVEALERLGALASRSGLAFVPLKGSVLATSRYGDPSLRPCADLDLLAPGDAFEDWSRLLVDGGYRLQTVGGKDSVFARPGARTPDSFAEHPDNPRPVELHRRLETRLLGRSHDVTDAYLSGLSDGTLHGVPARLPSDRALALHLLVHAAPDLVGRGLRLIQFQDFTTLSPDDGLAEAAGELLGEAAWGVGALLAAWLPDALPTGVMAGLARFAPPPRRRRAWLARPGLLTGSEERRLLVVAEARLCRSPAELARRIAQAVPERSFLERAYGKDAPVTRLARYYRDRFRG